MSHRNKVVCKVPGSTSNCGSGFDSLGIGLSIYNYIEVERMESTGEKTDPLRDNAMVRATVDDFFREAGIEPFDVSIAVSGEVPQARGLGSSVTVRGGILAGLSQLSGAEWSMDRLVERVTWLEGHPDNASASLLGGFTVSLFGKSTGYWKNTLRFPIGESLRFVVVSPDFEVLTSDSRNALPQQMAFNDVVTSINGVSCFVAAMASGEYTSLKGTVKDFVHEPKRLEKIPGAREAIDRGIEAGAYTGWLSGSGSSVLCVCEKTAVSSVGDAMKKAFADSGLASLERDLCADNEGLKVVEVV